LPASAAGRTAERQPFGGAMTRFVFAVPVFLLAPALLASADDLPLYAERPASIIGEIAKRGASPVVQELNQKPAWESWARVVDAIAKGERDWLMAAMALLKGADGGASDDLRLAVSRAVVPSAADVLDIFMGQVSAPRICWATAEFGGHDTLESALGELRAKIASVESVSNPRLAGYQAECLNNLRSGERELYAIYGKPPP
jgi:hypothetical protein